MAMLQTVMRPSTDSARMALPAIDGMAGAAGRADDADDVQHHVLAVQPKGNSPSTLISMLLAFFEQRLRRQHVLDLGRADAESQRAQRAVRAGVRVAADHGHAGQRGALLRSDHVHDALTQIIHAEFGDAVLVAVGVQRVHLQLETGSSMPWARFSVGTL